MQTEHQVHPGDARDLGFLAPESVDLVVTSPPYPMVAMWDELFGQLSPAAADALAAADGPRAFEAMHVELDRVWTGLHRALRPGGIAAINIGDTTRTLGGEFALYSNHARILTAAARLGFTVLPDILWRKPTNAPNKFMGSGMLPAGAYVTYEHEYILILRKGAKRAFSTESERARRRRSAFFWEERNQWFSDLWSELPGTQQALRAGRDRSAAFPFALAWRLIHMFSAQGDRVLDPFLGTGTTLVAAMCAGRHGLGVERDLSLLPIIETATRNVPALGNDAVDARLSAHMAFVRARQDAGKTLEHQCEFYSMPVITNQETELVMPRPVAVEQTEPGRWRVSLVDEPTRRALI